MKETAIKKINKIGKFSYIAAIIAKCFVIVGLVTAVIAGIVCMAMFGDSMKMDMAGLIHMELDCEALEISSEDIMEILNEEGTEINRQELAFSDSTGDVTLNISDEDYTMAEIEYEENANRLLVDLEADAYSFTLKEVGIMMLVSCIGMVMTIVTITFVESLCKAFRDCTSPFEGKVIKKMQNLAISLIPWTIVSSVINSTLDSFLENGFQLNLSIDLGVVLVVLIVFILVYIFKYGAVLQQESDETL